MAKQSAGILVYRRKRNLIEVLLVHPGGPFWARKDNYAWSIPKGEYQSGEDVFEVARREFSEELGQPAPSGEFIELGSIKQAGGKTITAWAIEKNLGDVQVKSNTFAIEWPPKSGRMQEFPEVDKAEWFDLSTASRKLHPGQAQLFKRLADRLGVDFKDQSGNQPLNKKLNDTQISFL